jgi:hypothetical protein
MDWWVGKYWVVLVVTVVSGVAGLLWFRNKAPGEVKDWRLPNYLILLGGGIGLLALLIDAQKDIGQRAIQIELPLYQSSLNFLKSDMHSSQRYFCDTRFQKSDLSPPNFDEISAEQKVLCDWFQGATAKIDPLVGLNAKGFRIDQVGGFPNSRFFADTVKLARDSYGRFDREREVLLAAESRSDTDEARIYISVFGPLLLGAALGLSLAKAFYVP